MVPRSRGIGQEQVLPLPSAGVPTLGINLMSWGPTTTTTTTTNTTNTTNML